MQSWAGLTALNSSPSALILGKKRGKERQKGRQNSCVGRWGYTLAASSHPGDAEAGQLAEESPGG